MNWIQTQQRDNSQSKWMVTDLNMGARSPSESKTENQITHVYLTKRKR